MHGRRRRLARRPTQSAVRLSGGNGGYCAYCRDGESRELTKTKTKTTKRTHQKTPNKKNQTNERTVGRIAGGGVVAAPLGLDRSRARRRRSRTYPQPGRCTGSIGSSRGGDILGRYSPGRSRSRGQTVVVENTARRKTATAGRRRGRDRQPDGLQNLFIADRTCRQQYLFIESARAIPEGLHPAARASRRSRS